MAEASRGTRALQVRGLGRATARTAAAWRRTLARRGFEERSFGLVATSGAVVVGCQG
ncbi:MAG: hypothetical protein AMXMBFR34_27880 [Myxococcaceae bacterium]